MGSARDKRTLFLFGRTYPASSKKVRTGPRTQNLTNTKVSNPILQSQYARSADHHFSLEDTSQVRHDDVSTAQWPCGGGQYALPADATASGGAIRRNAGPTSVEKILRNRTSSPRKNRENFRSPGDQSCVFCLVCRKNAVGASVLCIAAGLRNMKGRTMQV